MTAFVIVSTLVAQLMLLAGAKSVLNQLGRQVSVESLALMIGGFTGIIITAIKLAQL